MAPEFRMYSDRVKSLFLAAILFVVACGCTPKAPTSPADSPKTVGSTGPLQKGGTPPAGNSAAGGTGTIAPIGPNIGAMTPVAGSESLDGGTGGGVGQSAKDMARKAAGQSSVPAGQTTGDE